MQHYARPQLSGHPLGRTQRAHYFMAHGKEQEPVWPSR
jgi:hypothetical protein